MKTTIRSLTLGAALAALTASGALAQSAYDYYNGRYEFYGDGTVLPYAPGYSAIPPGAEYHPYGSGQPYGVPNYWQPDRTYPGQVTGYPPFGTPFYPGPRPSGPKSYGGT